MSLSKRLKKCYHSYLNQSKTNCDMEVTGRDPLFTTGNTGNLQFIQQQPPPNPTPPSPTVPKYDADITGPLISLGELHPSAKIRISALSLCICQGQPCRVAQRFDFCGLDRESSPGEVPKAKYFCGDCFRHQGGNRVA